MYLNHGQYLLGLHSSTKDFGVAVLDLKKESRIIETSIVKFDRKLSNNLFDYIEKLLPNKYWSQIARLAVSTGPGSFTGTRITLAMARILAQQINCQIDGISSFSLMAPRLSKKLNEEDISKPFWIIQSIKRQGYIAGKYQVMKNKESRSIVTSELKEPFLLKQGEEVYPALSADEDLSLDIHELMNRCLIGLQNENVSPWQKVLPIYPTSPVN